MVEGQCLPWLLWYLGLATGSDVISMLNPPISRLLLSNLPLFVPANLSLSYLGLVLYLPWLLWYLGLATGSDVISMLNPPISKAL